MFGCINLEGWIGEHLQDGIVLHVKRFKEIKLEITKQLL